MRVFRRRVRFWQHDFHCDLADYSKSQSLVVVNQLKLSHLCRTSKYEITAAQNAEISGEMLKRVRVG